MKTCCNQNCSQGRNCPDRTLGETTLLEKISKWLKSVWNTWLVRLGAKILKGAQGILRFLLRGVIFTLVFLWGAATIFLFLGFGMLFYGIAKDVLLAPLLPFLKPLLTPLIKLLGSL